MDSLCDQNYCSLYSVLLLTNNQKPAEQAWPTLHSKMFISYLNTFLQICYAVNADAVLIWQAPKIQKFRGPVQMVEQTLYYMNYCI